MKHPGTYCSSSVHRRGNGPLDRFLILLCLADPAQVPAAIGTGICARRQFDFHPRDVVWDRTALGFVLLLDVGQLHPCCHCRRGDLTGLERELQLLRRLARRAKPVRPVPSQLMTELLDQNRLRLHLGQEPRGEAAQLLGVFRQSDGPIQHGYSLSHCIRCGNL